MLPIKAIRKPFKVDPRPPHSRDSPRLIEAISEWRSVGVVVDDGSVGRLSARADAQLQEAILHKYPLVIRHRQTSRDSPSLRDSWRRFVAQDSEQYQVNQGAKTDNLSGASSHSPGLLPLAQVWCEARRLEVGLKDTRRGQTNPVIKWLRHCPRSEPEARGVSKLLDHLRRLVMINSQVSSRIREPAFVTGTVQPGGGSTHFDDYDNLAVVLVGHKTFYIAPPPTFWDAPLEGKYNERLGVSPHDRLTSNAEDWEVAHLTAGDMLYLPVGWWHFVDSQPRTVMTNIWSQVPDTSPTATIRVVTPGDDVAEPTPTQLQLRVARLDVRRKRMGE
jgi:hypothetical protein